MGFEIPKDELADALQFTIKARHEGVGGGAGVDIEVDPGALELLKSQWEAAVIGMDDQELNRLETVHQYGGFREAMDRLTQGYKLVGAPTGDNYAETAEAIRERTDKQYGKDKVIGFTMQPLMATVDQFEGLIYGRKPADIGDGTAMVGLACYAKIKE